MGVHPLVAHRIAPGKGLELSEGVRPAGAAAFTAIGGRPAVERVIDGLYDRIEKDRMLRPKFGADFSGERLHTKAFFEEWLGGEPRYSQQFAQGGMRQIHSRIHITAADAARWLEHFRAAAVEGELSPKALELFLPQLKRFAVALVNRRLPANAKQHRQVCHDLKGVARLARKGDIARVDAACEDEPELLGDHGALLLFEAAGAGRTELVTHLIDRGVDPNLPFTPAPWYGWARTALCHARDKGRRAAVELLLANGALDDVFTCAWLGETEALGELLAAHPELANVHDPAHDFFEITPIYHAVMAGRLEAARRLFDAGAEAGKLSHLLVRHAAAQGQVEMLAILLEHGADATRVGPGRWVLHPDIAPLLDAHGADVNFTSTKFLSWQWLTCSGNRGWKEDVEYLGAILARGAEVNSTAAWGCTALHFTAKSGFASATELLLANGADPSITDETGRSPAAVAQRVARGGKDRSAVIELLHGQARR